MSNKWVSIGIWGDSIVHGGCDPVMGGWVNRLRLYLWNRGLGDHVFNLGLGGNCSIRLLQRIGPELDARIGHIEHAMVSVGVNDLLLSIPEELFEQNLRAIIQVIQAKGKGAHLLSMIPIQKEREKWLIYNAIIERVAMDTGSGFVDLRDCVDASNLPDLVHPDGFGHERIFQAVRSYLIGAGLVLVE